MRTLATCITTLLIGLTLTAQADDLPHRDDFTMNAIGGGDFRAYVMDHVAEDDGWAQAMRTLGVLHNHMHEMMTQFAHHAMEETDQGERVPGFEQRISGGEWSDYRAALEENADTGSWPDMVQITEIMHDRVHHMMVSAVFYDHASRQRDADLEGDYLDGRAPHPQRDTLPEAASLKVEFPAPDAFRERVWRDPIDGERWHAALQKVTVFEVLLQDLMTQFAQYGMAKLDSACRPPEGASRVSGEDWSAYADRVSACEETEWQHLVRITGLAHDRVQHMALALLRYDAERHDRETPEAMDPTGQ